MRGLNDSSLKKRLLYFCPAVNGGIADYGREQAQAIAQAGVEVLFLTTPGFNVRPGDGYQVLPRIGGKPAVSSGALLRWRSRLGTARQILANARGLLAGIQETGCSHVLLASYAEYLAPFWAGKLQHRARQGTVFGAIVHDPVRHAVVGPSWWHRRSIAAGYSFLREAFVHEPVVLDTVRPQPRMRTTVIPHGMFAVTAATRSASQMREEWNLPAGAKVLLSFGHIKDYKNLELAIRVLAKLPEFYLVVAGKESFGREHSVDFYRELAARTGVADRCRWCVGHIPEDQIGNFFGAADLVLLTYNRAFRSASGVLNLVAGYRKPCIASSGASNLQTVIKKYSLGIWVEPDSEAALLAGIHEWQAHPPAPAWEHYERENSWAKNAEIVVRQMF